MPLVILTAHRPGSSGQHPGRAGGDVRLITASRRRRLRPATIRSAQWSKIRRYRGTELKQVRSASVPDQGNLGAAQGQRSPVPEHDTGRRFSVPGTGGY